MTPIATTAARAGPAAIAQTVETAATVETARTDPAPTAR